MSTARPEPTAAMESVVVAQSVSKAIAGRPLLCDASLTVYGGEIHGLMGPNGSGKTTLLRLFAGIWIPDRGSIRRTGASLDDIGYVAQRTFLYDELTVAENLRFHARMRGFGPAALAALEADFAIAAIARIRLGRLSGGQRQRVMLAAALLHAPRLLLLDEPTTALDRPARRQLWALLRREARRGRAIVLTSHEEGDALECDVVTWLADGRVVRAGDGSPVG